MALLFSAFTRFNPLAERQAFDSVLDTGEGDVTKQLFYLTLFALSVLNAKWANWRTITPQAILLFAWFGTTILWSPVPDIAVRRFLLAVLIGIITFLSVSNMSFTTALKATGHTITFMLFASLVAGVSRPELAFHQLGDPESGIVGDFRGIFYHKNLLGSGAAIGLLLSGWQMQQRVSGKWLPTFAFAASLLCLGLSHSKTSIALSILLVPVFFLWCRYDLTKTAAKALLLLALPMLVIFWDTLAETLSDPLSFTGRVLIWNYTYEIFLNHPLLGAGYQSIFQAGEKTIFAVGSASTFITTLSQAHNAYLETAASTGLVGLLALATLIYQNIFASIANLGLDRTNQALLFVLPIFILLNSTQESGLGDRDNQLWVVMLVLIAIISTRKSLLRSIGQVQC